MDLFSGKLSADSSNVVQLVKAQYEAITSSIEMKDNATGSVKVKIIFFSLSSMVVQKVFLFFSLYSRLNVINK
jgi:hypothetical protein